jgi:hypothetical protein
MKCSLCQAAADLNRFDGITAGWRLSEAYGPAGNKYGVFCPKEKTADIGKHMTELMAEVTGGKK